MIKGSIVQTDAHRPYPMFIIANLAIKDLLVNIGYIESSFIKLPSSNTITRTCDEFLLNENNEQIKYFLQNLGDDKLNASFNE